MKKLGRVANKQKNVGGVEPQQKQIFSACYFIDNQKHKKKYHLVII